MAQMTHIEQINADSLTDMPDFHIEYSNAKSGTSIIPSPQS